MTDIDEMEADVNERRTLERREVTRSDELKATVLHIIVGFLLAIVLNYFTMGEKISRIENRLTTIESVVCASQTCYRVN